MTKDDFEAFKKAWSGYPSQDNEGYVPDRGGFKCGWFAALEYERKRSAVLVRTLELFEVEVCASRNKDAKTEVARLKQLAIDALKQYGTQSDEVSADVKLPKTDDMGV